MEEGRQCFEAAAMLAFPTDPSSRMLLRMTDGAVGMACCCGVERRVVGGRMLMEERGWRCVAGEWRGRRRIWHAAPCGMRRWGGVLQESGGAGGAYEEPRTAGGRFVGGRMLMDEGRRRVAGEWGCRRRVRDAAPYGVRGYRQGGFVHQDAMVQAVRMRSRGQRGGGLLVGNADGRGTAVF